MSIRIHFRSSVSSSQFSESTASGMEFYARRDECKKLHMSAATVQFTRRMNDLYDCLNTKRPQQVQYNEAEHITTLKENIKWLDRWYEYIQTLPKQRQICFLSKPTSEALRLTLHSVVALIEYLLKSGFQYVLVGNFGQDPLERFFGITRHVAGDGGQPTVQQFLFIYRMLSVNNIVQPPKRASVDCEGPNLLLKLQDISAKKAPTTNQADILAVLFDEILLEPADEDSLATFQPLTTKQSILDYLGGYVVKKFSTMTCTACLKMLKTSSRQPSDFTATKSKVTCRSLQLAC
uniref:Transposable element P transposase-like GTP-binding insertion domain-containing protein n=1 Tax=Rhipicephalus zambeziensis TaxID=60191 RepID=A0A224YT25_9ACAR